MTWANVRFLFLKKIYERRKRHCFNTEQQKVIEMKGTISYEKCGSHCLA